MADKSQIDWCTASLNPFGWGCYGPYGTPSSPKICPGCYAHTMSKGPYPRCKKCAAFIPHWHPEDIDKARSWKKPREIFWQSMGDMWHQFTKESYIDKVLEACIKTPQHTHLFLTKNPSRYLYFKHHGYLPKDNAYYGVTIRDQDEAVRYLPILLELAIAGFKTYISYEPALDEIYLGKAAGSYATIDQSKGPGNLEIRIAGLVGVIAGGMNGRGSIVKPTHPDHIRSMRDQCIDLDIPFFFKGWGQWKYSDGPDKDLSSMNLREAQALRKFKGSEMLYRPMGKKKSGRLLDGREHNDLAWRK